MKLHGWTDAFQMYFHSFYRKKKIKLGNRRIHTKSIYFVDLNQDFSRKTSIMLRCDSIIFSVFIWRMKSNLLNSRTHTKAIYFLPQSKKASNQIMTFHFNVKTWWDVTVCVVKMIFQCGTMKLTYSRIHTCIPLLRFKQELYLAESIWPAYYMYLCGHRLFIFS